MIGDKLRNCLKELRLHYGYSQQQLADLLHIARQTYSSYETGRISPPMFALLDLAEIYGLSPEYLIELHIQDYYRTKSDNSPHPVLISLKAPPRFYDIDIRFHEKKDYSEFIEQYDQKEYPLRSDERICLYYYNALDTQHKLDTLTHMRIIKDRLTGYKHTGESHHS